MTKYTKGDCCVLDIDALSGDAYREAAEGGHFQVANTFSSTPRIEEWTEREQYGGGYTVVSIRNPESSEDDLPETRSFLVPNVGDNGQIVLARLSKNKKFWVIVLGEEIELS